MKVVRFRSSLLNCSLCQILSQKAQITNWRIYVQEIICRINYFCLYHNLYFVNFLIMTDVEWTGGGRGDSGNLALGDNIKLHLGALKMKVADLDTGFGRRQLRHREFGAYIPGLPGAWSWKMPNFAFKKENFRISLSKVL